MASPARPLPSGSTSWMRGAPSRARCSRPAGASIASGQPPEGGARGVAVLHPQGRIDVDVIVEGRGDDARIRHTALVRTARKILQGDLHLPDDVFSRPVERAGS